MLRIVRPKNRSVSNGSNCGSTSSVALTIARGASRAFSIWKQVALAILTMSLHVAAQALPTFQDDFNAAGLDASRWRQLAFHGQTAVSTGSTVIFSSQNYADTCGRYVFAGTDGITVEARMRGPGTNRDVTIQLMEVATGDTIASGDTSYFGSMYLSASGQFASNPAFGGASTAQYKEYRFSLVDSTAKLERGDAISALNETISTTLAASVVGKAFYLRIGAGGPTFFPSEFDWIRVNGTRIPNTTACPTAAVVGTTVDLVTPDSAIANQSTVFSVFGSNLPSGLGFMLGDCTPSNLEINDATTSSSLRKFRCTPRGAPGAKYGRVKTSPGGTAIASFSVNVASNLISDEVAELVFDGPIGNQQTGQQFQVRIRAVNSAGTTVNSYNELVHLSRLPAAALSRLSAQFINGEWTGSIAVLTSGVGKLAATFQRTDRTTVEGLSDEFDVSNVSDRQVFTLTGRTLPTVSSVQLTRSDDASTRSTTVGADGKFQFTSVSKGKYRVRVDKAGFRQISEIAEFVVSKDTTLPTIEIADQSRFVLLVPGMMGSTLRSSSDVNTENFTGFVVAATLPVNESCSVAEASAIASSLKLYEPSLPGTDFVGWEKMRVFLRTLGFQVVDVPWDWRCTAKAASIAYLKAAVERLRLQDPNAEISIVSHSMGGLVAREYIQSSSFSGDIANFVMLGTPNAGSTKAYFLMEGGDPARADGRWGTLYAAVYENAIESLYKSRGNFTLVGKSSTFKRSFIRDSIPGGFDLMPVYPFLRRGSIDMYGLCREQIGATVQSMACGASSVNSCNPNLIALNNDANAARFVPFANSLDALQVRTMLYLSNSDRDTPYIVNFCSANQAGSVYDQGIPSVISSDLGDGTVRSALGLAFTGNMQELGAYGSHSGMPGALAETVAMKLASVSPRSTVAARSGGSTVSVASVPLLQVRGSGTVDLALQLPDGTVTGTSTHGVVTEIPNLSEVVNFDLLRAINVFSPTVGRYNLTVRTPINMQRTLQILRLTVGGPLSPSDLWLRILPGQPSSTLQFDLTNAANQSIGPVDAVLPPTDLTASRSATGAILSWTASAAPTTVGYRIFARENAKSAFDLLGETTNTTFSTNLQWASSGEDLVHFVVLAVNTSGDESFVYEGNYTTNASYTAALFQTSASGQSLSLGTTLPVTVAFIDQSKSSSPITKWSWDFNGDGLPDSDAQHPTFVFNSYGRHTVSLSVSSDDGSDTNIRALALNIAPCTPQQAATTCTLDVNGDGVADARDGLLILRRLLGFKGAALTSNLVSPSCETNETSTSIAAFIDDQLLNNRYNVDNASTSTGAASNGLLLYRALSALSGDAVTANVIRPGATRTAWEGAGQIREYLNTSCGAGL